MADPNQESAKQAYADTFCELSECEEEIAKDALQFQKKPQTQFALMISALFKIACLSSDGEGAYGTGLIPENDELSDEDKDYENVVSFYIENTGGSDVTYTTTNQPTDQTVTAGKRVDMPVVPGTDYGDLNVDATGTTADVAVVRFIPAP